MSKVQHIELGTVSLFTTGSVAVTTRKESYSGPTPVLEGQRSAGRVGLWGPGNDHPQRVVDDLRRTPLAASVIERKVNMLISGGLRYGTLTYDEKSGLDILKPQRLPEVEKFFKDINIKLFLREAARDWYTFYNVFVEYRMGRGYDRITGMGVQDACHVRLGTMNDQAEITNAFINDWRTNGDSSAFELPALDPYRNVAGQILKKKDARSILPIRILGHDQFYYGVAPWHGLQADGSLDIAARILELKKLLLDNIMLIRYHIEIDERYWPKAIPGYAKMDQPAQIAAMTAHVVEIEKWLKGDGHGGAWMSTMLQHGGETGQTSLVKIHEKQLTIPDGAYNQDTQESHFIICRDMGLKPSLHGISPSKSGSSPGSGSEDRIARTNHILDSKSDQDQILMSLEHVRDVNGWPEDLTFWFSNYHAATLDRTNGVDQNPNAGPER